MRRPAHHARLVSPALLLLALSCGRSFESTLTVVHQGSAAEAEDGGNPDGDGSGPAGPIVLSPGFVGLSYEKSHLSLALFDERDAALVALFRRLGPGILRVGANDVERARWTPAGAGLTAGEVAPPDQARLAAFLRATGWRVLYGVSLARGTPAAAASEAASAAALLGDRLYGFEIGNEPDLYAGNGLRPASYTYADFRGEWESFAAAIRDAVPGAVLTGPSAWFKPMTYPAPFAADEAATISLLTMHYYRSDARSSSSTAELLVSPDPALEPLLHALDRAARTHGIRDGWRLTEANSFFNHGRAGSSDTFASALWVVDFLFATAAAGGSGVDLHSGAARPYTPIADDGAARVTTVRPEYYGLLLYTLAAQGTLLSTRLDPALPGETAWAVAAPEGATRVVIVNASNLDDLRTVKLGVACTRATLITLEAPSLTSTSGVTLQGAPILPDGSWDPPPAQAVPVDGARVQVKIRAGTAVMLDAW